MIAVENSCRIGGKALNGTTAMSDVTISLSGTHTDTANTDAGGNYVFAGLRCGGNYTVSASKTGYTFTPSSKIYSNLSQDEMATNFNAAAVYSITGRVTLSGAGFSGVTVTLSGSQAGSTTTDSSGNYTFSGLAGGGSYTVTPSQSGYGFSPTNRTYSSLSANQTGADFTATLITYTVSGRITVAGTGASLPNVTVTLTGSQSRSTQTDTNGNYLFSGLPAGGNYALTPALATYTFNPASRMYNNLSADQTTADFQGTRITYTVSGRITVAGTGASLPNVTVTLTGSQSGSAQTDTNGNYSFPGLAAGGNYTVTPLKSGYTFSPGSLNYTNLSANQTAANFTGSTVTYSISGRVTEGALEVSGVTVSLSGSQSSSTSTDANGYYTLGGLAAGGNYTVTPSKAISHSTRPR